MKKVSVIIPTHKRSNSLIRAINSVLNQSYKNIEIIVVDDNDQNSDYRKNNEKKLSIYRNDKRVIYLKHEKNMNGACARNTGIKKATGDYITFLDDDDYFLKERIEKLVNKLEQCKNYQGCYTSVIYIQKDKIIKKLNALKNGNLKWDLLNQNSFFGTGSNIFLRKEVIKKIGLFDSDFIRHQDIEYMIRFFNFCSIINLDEFLVVKCVDDKANIPNFSKMLEVKKLFFKKFEKDIKEYKNKENEIYYNNYLQLLYMGINDKNNFKYSLNLLKKYKKISYKVYLKCCCKKIFLFFLL